MGRRQTAQGIALG